MPLHSRVLHVGIGLRPLSVSPSAIQPGFQARLIDAQPAGDDALCTGWMFALHTGQIVRGAATLQCDRNQIDLSEGRRDGRVGRVMSTSALSASQGISPANQCGVSVNTANIAAGVRKAPATKTKWTQVETYVQNVEA